MTEGGNLNVNLPVSDVLEDAIAAAATSVALDPLTHPFKLYHGTIKELHKDLEPWKVDITWDETPGVPPDYADASWHHR